MASFVMWAIGNSNAKLLDEVHNRMEQQNRTNFATVGMYQGKVALLEKQIKSLQKDLKDTKKDLQQEITSLKKEIQYAAEREPPPPVETRKERAKGLSIQPVVPVAVLSWKEPRFPGFLS